MKFDTKSVHEGRKPNTLQGQYPRQYIKLQHSYSKIMENQENTIIPEQATPPEVH